MGHSVYLKIKKSRVYLCDNEDKKYAQDFYNNLKTRLERNSYKIDSIEIEEDQ